MGAQMLIHQWGITSTNPNQNSKFLTNLVESCVNNLIGLIRQNNIFSPRSLLSNLHLSGLNRPPGHVGPCSVNQIPRSVLGNKALT